MREKNRLFPIGVLSKLTGVHIRCLRYYEELGILQPAYVNENTGYRYYTYRQMRIVEAIQYCIELDVPLKKFAEFLSQKNGQIDYEKLAEYGKKITEEKLQSILERQRLLEEMQAEMAHAQICVNEHITEIFSPERHFYCSEFDGTQSEIKFQSAMVKLINDMGSNGFRPRFDNGILIRKHNNELKHYCFVEIKNTSKDFSDYPQIFTVPSGVYKCATCKQSGRAENIFAEELAADNDIYIIETELFTGKFIYVDPTYELRCYTGNKK